MPLVVMKIARAVFFMGVLAKASTIGMHYVAHENGTRVLTKKGPPRIGGLVRG
jgi:hypothetical protein